MFKNESGAHLKEATYWSVRDDGNPLKILNNNQNIINCYNLLLR